MTSWMHWPVAPLLVPLVAGAALLLIPRESWRRATSFGAALLFALLGLGLFSLVGAQGTLVYALGDWPTPFGIVLVADRLSSMLVLLTGVLGLGAIGYAIAQGEDRLGPNFHSIFQFQLLGVSGAFLTGDLFNLFVFFEIMLIASYCLLLHGQGEARIRAALRVVVLNLVGSALFLIAIGVIYGTLGTLNMADLAVRVSRVPAESVPLLAGGALLLLVVFGLKAALFPLYLWLPSAYSAACASVACVFAILTKVGIYSILRVYTLIFGDAAGPLAQVAAPWLLPTALVTVTLGAAGVLGSASLPRQIGYLVVVSVGTTLASVGLFTSQATAAAIYYLIQSTVITAGLYLLADQIRRREADPPAGKGEPRGAALLGALFFIAAVAASGLPPASGFVGKLMILEAAGPSPAVAWVWTLILGASFVSVVAMARAGSSLFWRPAPEATQPSGSVAESAAIVTGGRSLGTALSTGFILGAFLLALFATPVIDQIEAAAEEVHDPQRYIRAVLGEDAALSEGDTP